MSSSPLSGVVVADLSRHLPGPLAAHLLADLGARVVKVEEPRLGDPVRLAPPLVRSGGGRRSALAALLLSGVESVALDLKRPAAREVLERLLARADVLLETFRPGTLARLGLAPEELRRRWPRLVVCSLSGWGQDGPRAGRAGHDLTYQAIAGALAPTAAMPAYPAADVAGAWSAVAAVLAALVERGRTGQGAWIDASLYDAAVHLNLVGWAAWADRAAPEPAAAPEPEGAPATRPRSRGPRGLGEPHGLAGALPCYRLYRTADGGLLAVAPLEPRFWRRFCELAGRGDLNRLQYREDEEAHRRVAEAVAGRSLAEWRELLAGADLPVEPVLSAAQAAEDPQAAARDLLRRAADGLPRLAFPARIDGERPRAGERFPELGEDTGRLLEEIGAGAARLGPAARRRAGVGPRAGLARLLTRWWLGRKA